MEPSLPPELAVTRDRVEVDSGVVAAYSQFGFRLFAEVTRRDVGKNVLLSPHSVATVLSMLYVGASGETRQALAAALGLENTDAKTITEANARFGKSLCTLDTRVEVILANAIWVRHGLELKREFVEQARESFDAEIHEVDFTHPTAEQIINRWAAANTKGKINRVVEHLGPLLVMIVMNAVYFKGEWARPFEPRETREESFRLLDGTKKSVPMMTQTGTYWYYRQEGFQAVNLPYGSGRISFSLFLPEESVGLAGFLGELNQKNWARWKFRVNPGRLVLPRFKFEYGTCLDEVLKTLGLESAFDQSKARFDGIGSQKDLFITEVRQRGVIEVNEQGTEAAAVTDLRLYGGPFELIADRPFFFAIRDNATDTLLFMGVVNDPSV